LQQKQLLRRGAEADLYLIDWYGGRKAVAKVRTEKPYRHRALDASVRRQRTIHEARLMSVAKAAGVPTPFVYFVNPSAAEIVMEFVDGPVAKDVLDRRLCEQMGRYAAMLHAGNIVHGDLTTSNFVVRGKSPVLLDFGLSYYSERAEDKAVDIRLIKEVFTSAHISLRGAFASFCKGYRSVAGSKNADKILENVKEIEQRGRYARVT
jgi:TP53 regulating kinase-like protein